MARAGTPAEIAESIMFLMSDASAYTTGANLRISGGR
jgi:NAD(P)-dependent dehydrogenase (short-subunit alcohol dehydrogenase family)